MNSSFSLAFFGMSMAFSPVSSASSMCGEHRLPKIFMHQELAELNVRKRDYLTGSAGKEVTGTMEYKMATTTLATQAVQYPALRIPTR
jgi:hypothetical protein